MLTALSVLPINAQVEWLYHHGHVVKAAQLTAHVLNDKWQAALLLRKHKYYREAAEFYVQANRPGAFSFRFSHFFRLQK